MTRTINAALALVGVMLLVAIGGYVAYVRLDRPGFIGTAIGAGLGIVNLVVGLVLARRGMRRGLDSALKTLLGGFFGRLLVVVCLVLAFHRTEAVDEVAFVLSFMVLFFVFLAVEMLLVERSMREARGTA